MDNKGTFKSALTQSFKGIKETKAAAITEDVELSYRRKAVTEHNEHLL